MAEALTLLSVDDTDSSEHVSSTSESAALKTYSLAANSYSKVLIEAIVQVRDDVDAGNKSDFTFRIKEAGSTVGTFTLRSMRNLTSGCDGGSRHVVTISHVIAGGQGGSTDLTITAQQTTSSADIGSQVKAFRVYAIQEVATGPVFNELLMSGPPVLIFRPQQQLVSF